MRTHVLPDDTILLDLDTLEHRALSHALCGLMSSIEPSDIEHILLAGADEAYEFAYSVYLLEARARTLGFDWLPAGECTDSLSRTDGAHPVLDIRFGPAGSTWCLSTAQLRFVELCLAAKPRDESIVDAA